MTIPPSNHDAADKLDTDAGEDDSREDMLHSVLQDVVN
jgi:hypothetical protein